MPGHTAPVALQYTKKLSLSVNADGAMSISNLYSRNPTMPGSIDHVLR